MVRRVTQTNDWLMENPPHVEWLLDCDCAEVPNDSDFVVSLMNSAKRHFPDTELIGVSSHTDMGWYCNTGTPMVNYGPGTVTVAHQADEYIDLEEYITYIKSVVEIVIDWCSLAE